MYNVYILNVLEELMEAAYFHCEWGISWVNNQEFITIQFQYPLKDELLPNHPFETPVYVYQLILYNSNAIDQLQFHQSHTIPIDDKQGIAIGELYCIVEYTRRQVAKIRLQLHEQPFSEELNLIQWNNCEYQRLVQTMKQSGRYNPKRVYFPY